MAAARDEIIELEDLPQGCMKKDTEWFRQQVQCVEGHDTAAQPVSHPGISAPEQAAEADSEHRPRFADLMSRAKEAVKAQFENVQDAPRPEKAQEATL